MNTSNDMSDDLRKLKADSLRLIGQSIVSSLLKKEHGLSEFNQFFGSNSYYNQSSGNYVQTDGGNYTQNGGGNYTQGPQAIGRPDTAEVLEAIRDLAIKNSK